MNIAEFSICMNYYSYLSISISSYVCPAQFHLFSQQMDTKKLSDDFSCRQITSIR